MLKKIIKLNNDGSIAVSIPAKIARELCITSSDYVRLEKVNQSILITKVKIE
jgi:antitoxin component of MazEF toxin-antitoxin module